MTKNDIEISDLIEVSYKVPESVFDKKRTKTSHFLLHSVFPNSSLMSTEYFVNAFIDDTEFKHRFLRPVFVLFKVSAKDAKWHLLANRLRAKNEYVLEYFCGAEKGKNLIMMVFQVPDKFAKDYISFKAGKYSHFTAEYKKLFPRYTHNDKAKPVESTVWRVIHKSDALKKELEAFFNVTKKGTPFRFDAEDELWGLPEPKYEIYRFKEKKVNE